MTNQDKHIRAYFKALDEFRKTLDDCWLNESKKHRKWLEKDIHKREIEKVESLQQTLFK